MSAWHFMGTGEKCSCSPKERLHRGASSQLSRKGKGVGQGNRVKAVCGEREAQKTGSCDDWALGGEAGL